MEEETEGGGGVGGVGGVGGGGERESGGVYLVGRGEGETRGFWNNNILMMMMMMMLMLIIRRGL